jgi:hypothetical protein
MSQHPHAVGETHADARDNSNAVDLARCLGEPTG